MLQCGPSISVLMHLAIDSHFNIAEDSFSRPFRVEAVDNQKNVRLDCFRNFDSPCRVRKPNLSYSF